MGPSRPAKNRRKRRCGVRSYNVLRLQRHSARAFARQTGRPRKGLCCAHNVERASSGCRVAKYFRDEDIAIIVNERIDDASEWLAAFAAAWRK